MKKIVLLWSVFIFLLACGEKPTAPQYTNPFDLGNPQTKGNPFKLTAKIANGGILLQWTKPSFKNLSRFNIYRSEHEKSGYIKIKSVPIRINSYTDTSVVNGHSYWYLVTAEQNGQESSRTNVAPVNIKTQPVLVINGGAQYTLTRLVRLTILAATAKQMMLSNQADFSGAQWEAYTNGKTWELPTGDGEKAVYLKVKYDNGKESQPVSATIKPQPVTDYSITISNTDTINTLDVTLHIEAKFAKKMMISNDNTFAECQWENYTKTKPWHLDFSKANNYTAKVYAKFKNDFEMETNPVSDKIFLRLNSGIKINNDAQYTSTRAVTLNLFSENADQMMISNKADFSGANWENYVTTKSWTLPTGNGPFTVYAKFKNASGLISRVYSDDISPQPMNPSITIANDAQYTSTRQVSLNLSATGSNLRMKLSEDSTFTGIDWQPYSATPTFQLSTGDGTKKVYAKFKNDFEIESQLVFDTIEPQPMNPSLTIANNAQYTTACQVSLNLSATGSNLRMKLSEDSTFTGIDWQPYSATPTFQLSTGDGTKKVYARFKNDFEIESAVLKDEIILDTTPPTAALTITPTSGITNETTFQFDPTGSRDNIAPAGDLRVRYDYENDGKFDTEWHNLQMTNYQFQIGGGDKTVKMQLKDGAGWTVETTKEIFVNTRPQAEFTATRDNTNYRIYHFDASASNDYEDGHSLQYRWDFDGDGVFDTNWITQDTISHVYDADGSYNVKLVVKDQNALTSEKVNEIQIKLVEMIFVQGGTFQMGDTWGDGNSDEKPVHTVTVNGFYMGKYEVTQAQYQEIMGTNPSYFKGDNRPVERVSWYDAVEFCNKLSEREGLEPCYTINGTDVTCDFTKNGYRLPTEAEWEYASRGGSRSAHYRYAGSDNVDAVAWYYDNSGSQTHEVGSKQPNELGIYDMSGNVWEWCWDWYSSSYYSSSPQDNPKGPSSGSYRVLRGGSWGHNATYVRVANRNYNPPNNTNNNLGFRLLRPR